jgi:class 3 adenylate cyclase/tetratricopeptide (TPR) repeat protein
MPDEFAFCPFCGRAIAAVPDQRPTERKVVTCLFCDLVGFTQRAEQMDPEDVSAVLSHYHERVRTELVRHGGTVEKFIGDAVMALFGAPAAHEDDAERAVRAALAVRDWAADTDGVRVRIAVTTGEALVRLAARPETGEGMASGDLINTAARLQSAAPVNEILVDEATQRATRKVVEYVEADSVEAKGKAKPVRVWRATGARSRFGVGVTQPARTPLIGREQELGVLREAFLRARGSRASQLVTLVAVPGMGKSRLVHELSRIVEADPEMVTWRQGRCLAYGDGVAFWALAEVVKAQAGIVDHDSAGDAAEKLRAAAVDATADESEARWVESHLRPLIGLEAETGLGGDRRGEAFAAWRRFLEGMADRRPFVLVLEDLHWADDGLLDFVDELVDWLGDVPLLVVCTARPELLERRPGWAGGKLNAATLALSPLSNEQTACLISEVLERPVLPATIQQPLVERAEGNPLYAEQFAELFVEHGSAEGLPLPETLQGVIAARIDGLSAAEKAVLQDASVVGKVFWIGALGREESETIPLLHGLDRKGFLIRQRRSSLGGEGEWAFTHMLLRDVAYGQIPRSNRAEKHRKTAEWIGSLGRSEDHAELLAHHWTSALELVQAAGLSTADLEKPTRLALAAAGDRALAVHGYASAAAHYQNALALCPPDDPTRPQLLYRRAHALSIVAGDAALVPLEEARDALIAAGDNEAAAEAEALISGIWRGRGRMQEAHEHLRRAERLAGEFESPASARVLAVAATYRARGTEPDSAWGLASRALELARALELPELEIDALRTIGFLKMSANDPSGNADLEEALRIALATGSSSAATILNNLGLVAWYAGDFRRGAELHAEAKRMAERFGDVSGVRWHRAMVAAHEFILGNWDEAVREHDVFVAECEAGSPHYMEWLARWGRGNVRFARGDIDGGHSDFERALELARDATEPQALVLPLGACMSTSESLGFGDRARGLARELFALVQPVPLAEACAYLNWTLLWSHSTNGMEGELRELVDRSPACRWKDVAVACLDRDFARAADLWRESGSPTWEAFLRERAGEELINDGRRAEGEAELEKALAFYRSVGATTFIERVYGLLTASRSYAP